ncbi:hypothetical protein HK104_001169 [Borealophlyctis nickersoniae]|nr:hypothetical protein HK104_001169 [Borealophlyctis nickersoniae]
MHESLATVKPHKLQKKINKAKKAARSGAVHYTETLSTGAYSKLTVLSHRRVENAELDIFAWGRQGYADTNFWIDRSRDTVPRIDYDAVSVTDFAERFEANSLPVVIVGATKRWNAVEAWKPENLVAKYHNEKFKVGEDDDGDPVYVPMKYFMQYALVSEDAEKNDSPLYIFDSNFGDRMRNNTAKRRKKERSQSRSRSPRQNEKSDESTSDRRERKRLRSRSPSRSSIPSDKKRGGISVLNRNGGVPSTERKDIVPSDAGPAGSLNGIPTNGHLANGVSHMESGIKDNGGNDLDGSNFPSLLAGESRPTSEMLKDYEVPKYFQDDLFRLTGKRRPPFRWVVIGPARSGTGIHVDPLGTSAWNALVIGHKRWALFPPNIAKNIVDPSGKPDHEAATWFAYVYPRLTSPDTRDESGKTLAERLGMIEILQGPDETVFVPGGWHHVVINLDFTVAITQNFCSQTNLEYVWLRTRDSRPRMAKKLLTQLERLGARQGSSTTPYAELAERIHALAMVPSIPPGSSSSNWEVHVSEMQTEKEKEAKGWTVKKETLVNRGIKIRFE